MRKIVLLLVVMAVWAYDTVIGQKLSDDQGLNVYEAFWGDAMADGGLFSENKDFVSEKQGKTDEFEVTFNVDMSYAPNFNPSSDIVNITGDMFYWEEPGTDPDNQNMARVDSSMIYTKTLTLEPGEYLYKYFLNYGWGTGEWEGYPDRSIMVESDMTVNNVWGFVTDQPLFEVTFSVDMTLAEGFNPTSDIVQITGSMFDWALPGSDPDNQNMTRVGNSMIYTKTLLLSPGQEYQYAFFLNNDWDQSEWDDVTIRSITAESHMEVHSIWSVLNVDELFAFGSGTQSDPWFIITAEKLNHVRFFAYDRNKYFKQIVDIDLGVAPWNEGEGWMPIGGCTSDWWDTPQSFAGNYDGNHKSINNLYINRPNSSHVGLFGAISGNVENVNILNADVSGGYRVGILSGSSYFDVWPGGKIDHCYVNGTVKGLGHVALLSGLLQSNFLVSNSTASGIVYSDYNSGGLVTVETTLNFRFENSFYSIDSIVINGGSHLCYGGLYDFLYQDWVNNERNLNISDYSDYLVLSGGYYEISTAEGLKRLLGFAGVEGLKFRLAGDIDMVDHPGFYIPYFRAQEFDGNHHTISNLNVSKDFASKLGFIANNRGLIKNLSLYGVNFLGHSNTGGIAGFNYNGTIENCFVHGNISSINTQAGGIVGHNRQGSVSACFAIASVSGVTAGGLVGLNRAGSISNSFARGSVAGTPWPGTNNYGYVGGLVSGQLWNNSSIVNSYSTSFVHGGGEIGGLIASLYDGEVTNSYWNTETSGQSTSAGGEGRTTAEMTHPHASNTYVGWDFQTIWQTDEDASVNDGYPYTFDFDLPELPEYTVSFTVSDMEGNPIDNARISLGPLTNALGEYDFVVNPGGYSWQVTAQGYSPETGTLMVTDQNELVSVVLSDLPLGLLVDIDGNVYETVIIGNQQWMTENLKVTTYSNGVPIDGYDLGDLAWSGNSSGAYVLPQLDTTFAYSPFYNWYATNNDNGLCPAGWYVPSDEDWAELENYVSQNTQSGNMATALKATYGWDPYSGTDEFGFEAIPMQYVNSDNQLHLFEPEAHWWSSTSVDDQTSMSRHLYYWHENLMSAPRPNNWGLSVRCTREAPQFFAGGTGTESDPWLIETPEHLNNIRLFMGLNHADKHFRQIADIDLDVPPFNQGEGWLPLGGSDGWFWGYYDGDGHTVSNLYINRSTNDYQGLFESNIGAIVNLGVVDANVTDHGSRAGILVGIVRNWNNIKGQVSNCYATGSITSNHEDGRIGGLVGWNDGDIYDSWSGAEVTSTGMIVGGLAGATWGGTFTNVYATGNVTGNYLVGGLVGMMQNEAHVTNSFASGNVVNQGSRTGGLVGNIQVNSTITGSFASGNVTGQDSHVGGLVGISFSGTEIIDSYATGRVISPNGVTGGLIGNASDTYIENTYASGKVETAGFSGGLIAFADSLTVVQNSFWDLQGTHQEFSDGGQGLSTNAMLQQASFSGWDFAQIWSINEGESYPWLNWQQGAGEHNYPVEPDVPQIEITYIKAVAPAYYVATADINDDGGSSILEKGFVWGTTPGVDVDNHLGIFNSTHDNQVFPGLIDALEPANTYHVRAFAVNDIGVAYSEAVTIETHPVVFAGGSGTESDPWLVSTPEHLVSVGYYLGNDHTDKHFRQIADIDLNVFPWNQGEGWMPIGVNYQVSPLSFNRNFSSTFDGSGFQISGLFINRPNTRNQGLFGYVVNAKLMNIKLTGVQITGNNQTGGLAGIVGNSEVKRCAVQGNISGDFSVGGVFGSTSNSIVEECFADINVQGNSRVGGFAGAVFGGVTTNNYVRGTLEAFPGSSGWQLSGFVALGWGNATILNSYSTVSTTDDTHAVAGFMHSHSGTIHVSNSFWDMESTGIAFGDFGTGLSTAEITAVETFLNAGWDIKGYGPKSVWNIGNDRNDGYPYFNWQFPGDPAPDAGTFPPYVITSSVTDISTQNAQVNGMVQLIGNPAATQYGICWNTSGSPTTNDETISFADPSPGDFSVFLDNLQINTTYYVRAFITNITGTYYGDELTFSTLPTEATQPAGEGTEENPYLISNLSELYWISSTPESWDSNFLQIADIDASETSNWFNGKGWQPIGVPFKGSYNGGNHTISNLYANRPDASWTGLLFRTVDGAIISDLNLENAFLKSASQTGLIAGQVGSGSQVTNVHVSGTIEAGYLTGGLFGLISSNSLVEGCSFSGNVKGATHTGGISGGCQSNSIIKDSWSEGLVEVDSWGGGLVGWLAATGRIQSSYSTADVVGNTNLGGIVGRVSNSEIANSYAAGNISGNGNIGGAVGEIMVSQSLIITLLENSYSMGQVSGNENLGGFVGTITYSGQGPFGDFVDSNNFWDTETSGQQESVIGMGLNTSDMVMQSSFTDWNFDTIWSINESLTYPWLQWQGLAGEHNYADVETVNITAEAHPAAGGFISGAGTYPVGGTVTLEAEPGAFYDFSHWSESGSVIEGAPATYTFTAVTDRHLVAHFNLKTYTITATASPSNGGTINGVNQYVGSYEPEQQVTLLAQPNTGFEFLGWIEGTSLVSDTPEYTFTATGHRSLVAWFDTGAVSVNAQANPVEGGNIIGSGVYAIGEPVTLIAQPAVGFEFVNWTENGAPVDGAGMVYGFLAETNRSLVANFSAKSYTIVALANPSHGGDVTGGGTYDHGDMVTLQANPAEGYRFVNWRSGNTIVSAQPNYSFVATGNQHLVATFALQSYTVTLQSFPHNNLGGSAEGGGTFVHGTEISVVASSNLGFDFDSWTEDATEVSNDNVYTFTVTSDRELVAIFAGEMYEITAEVLPETTGTVTGSGTYYAGEVVTLETEANSGYYFLRWMHGNQQVSVNSTYMFSANQDKELTAEFAQVWWDTGKPTKENQVLITATVEPSATGVVLGQGYYQTGETVTLVASPNVGLYFVGWQDLEGNFIVDSEGHNVGAEYTFTAETDRVLKAIFDGDTYTVEVEALPTEGGQVSVSDAGTFFQGDFAQLNAVPHQGYRFRKWTIGADGPQVSVNQQYGFTVTEDVLLVAHFEPLAAIDLTLSAIPEEGGVVQGEGSFVPGTEVTVGATANLGYSFLYWLKEGELFGLQPDTTFVLAAAMHLEAIFDIHSYSINADVNLVSAGAVSGAGIYEHGQEVTLTATAVGGYHFVRWEENGEDVTDGNGGLAGSIYVFEATEHRSLEAVFQRNIYTVSASSEPAAAGEIIGSGEYEHLEQVNLTATAYQGYTFLYWTENGVEVAGAEADFSFNAIRNRALVAHFELADDTSISELPEGKVMVFPNPASTRVNIESTMPVKRIILMDLGGRTVFVENVDDYAHSISLNDFKAGMYILRIETMHGILFEKVTIQK